MSCDQIPERDSTPTAYYQVKNVEHYIHFLERALES
ncbi:MAG: hypothetical protein ACI87O_000313 [Planctomycetota bacterium]|jgi:hypothetical protein